LEFDAGGNIIRAEFVTAADFPRAAPDGDKSSDVPNYETFKPTGVRR
jgi:hypothetical protein